MKKFLFGAIILVAAGIQVGNAQQAAPKVGPFVATLGPGVNDCSNNGPCTEDIFMGTNLDGSCYGNIFNGRIEIPKHRNPNQKIDMTWILKEDPQSPVKNDKYEFTAQGIVIKYVTPKDFDKPGHAVGSRKKKFKWRSVNEHSSSPREFEYDAYVVHGNDAKPCKVLDPKVVNKN